ncbi:flavin reductase family protein [Lysinibacillus sp. NPDC097279]|uniref:flavin reductase family protein n=1 Tax=Lysinibacillus sp. NPDC097279 TaxID=3364143 RepID=UPI003822659F
MRKPVDRPVWYAYPGMVAVVTTQHNGEKNVMASGWHTYIGSSPSMYGISLRKETHTYKLIEKSGVFAINFLPGHCSELIQAVGTRSGVDIDKFKEFNISYEQGIKADVPILTEAYFAYECRVHSIATLADHEWIAGEVLQRYIDQDLFLENGLPNLDKLDIPLYIGRSNYRILNSDAEEHHHAFYHKTD